MEPHREGPETSAAPGAVRHHCGPAQLADLRTLLARFAITVVLHPEQAVLPGSYWGEPEAGIVGTALHVRADTPIHSALHEACHLICMDPARRASVHTDAEGDDPEEAAVCLLQVLLADHLPGVGRADLMADMDAWGYSFRLGATANWFAGDSEDAFAWLRAHRLIDGTGAITFRLRSA
jgi:hypothetical protein